MSSGTPSRVINKPPLPSAARGPSFDPSKYATQESVDALAVKLDRVEDHLAKILALLESSPPPVPSPSSIPSTLASIQPTLELSRQVYEASTRAFLDRSEYAEKIGKREEKSITDGLKKDEALVGDLIIYCGSTDVKKAWTEGSVQFKRHPADRPPGSRPLKILFKEKHLRDAFLSGIRSKPGRPPPLVSPSSFVRKDLTPSQLQMEREARTEAVRKNVEAGQLMFGVRDYSLITYRNPRPLPPHYGSPRASRSQNLAADVSSPGLSLFSTALDEMTALSHSTPPSRTIDYVTTRKRL